MFKNLLLLVVLAAFTSAKPSARILERELTKLLQEYLAPLDPVTVPSITDLSITTDHSSMLFSATDATISGFGLVVVTSFIPPVPVLSKKLILALRVENFDGHTLNYTLNGSFKGEDYAASGVGDIVIDGMQLTIKLKTASYSLISPISICIEFGSLSIDLAADGIVANFEGADEVNEDINNHADNLLEQIEAQINAKAGMMESVINNALCKSG